MAEVVVGNTSIKVKTGDITTECTDAIVNLNNETLNQNFGVSKEILAAAGDTVQKECASLGTLRSDKYAVTKAGKLNCKNIIHLVDVTSLIIVESVKRALKACDEHKLRTVSLPAIGTGLASLDPQSSIKLIFEGLEGYLTELGTSTIISEITIVVNKQDVYKGYMTFFQNYQTNYSYFKAYGKSIVLNKGDITNQPVDCIFNLTNSSLNQSKGVSKAILDAAGDAVKDECKRIGPLKSNGIAITSGGKLKSKKIMHAVGPVRVTNFEEFIHKFLLECCKNSIKRLAIPAIGTGMAGVRPEDSIKAILNAILKYLERSSTTTLEIISIVVLQEDVYKAYLKFFIDKRSELQHCPQITYSPAQRIQHCATATDCSDDKVEKMQKAVLIDYFNPWTYLWKYMYGSSPYRKFRLNKQDDEIKNLNQQDACFLCHVDSIKNINEEGFNQSYNPVRIEYPETWTDTEKEELQVITLKENSKEYKNVEENFVAKLPSNSFTVDKIERIQNLKQFQSYSIKKQAVDRNNPGNENERHLYHGTTFDSIKNINKGGFNRSYCGKNATVYGLGTYFAVNPSYSFDDQYSKPDNDGKKYIYQAAVITGRYCEGKSEYKEPPYIDGNPNGDRYESVVDTVVNTDMFVVFYDDCAYPEYLITLKPYEPPTSSTTPKSRCCIS